MSFLAIAILNICNINYLESKIVKIFLKFLWNVSVFYEVMAK